MSARDDYPVVAAHEANEWRGASVQFGQALDEIDRLRAAILDIDAHATPMGLLREDDPEGSPGYYHLTVGALHRALGVVGHSAVKKPQP